MNVNPLNYDVHILYRLRQWWELAGMGINQSDRTKARKNFRALVRKYPELAHAHGFTLESVEA